MAAILSWAECVKVLALLSLPSGYDTNKTMTDQLSWY